MFILTPWTVSQSVTMFFFSFNWLTVFKPVQMEQTSTSSQRRRWIRDVPTNMCLIYMAHLPLSVSVINSWSPNNPSMYMHREDISNHYRQPKGRFMDFKTISNNFWFSMQKWSAWKYHTLLLYPFCSVDRVDPWLYLFSLTPWLLLCISGSAKVRTSHHKVF